MPAVPGDLSIGRDQVLIKAANRHVYYSSDPPKGVGAANPRLCRRCDLEEFSPYKDAVDHEKPCPKTAEWNK